MPKFILKNNTITPRPNKLYDKIYDKIILIQMIKYETINF